MSGHRHHGPGAVLAQDEVRHPQRHGLPGKRVHRVATGEEPFLLDLTRQPGGAVLSPEPLRLRPKRLRAAGLDGKLLDQLVLRRQQDEGCPVNRVDSRGEDVDASSAFGHHRQACRAARLEGGRHQREADAGPLRSPDPVPLHRQDLLGPIHEAVRRVEQFLRVMRDPQEPLLQVPGRDERAAAPAPALDDLLVGQHRLAAGAPVDRRAPPVGEAALVHLQEQPLVPLVVVHVAGCDFAVPRVADAQALQLPLHVRDVRARGRFRVDAALDRRVLGGKAERIPTEGVQDVEAARPLVARDDVANHVVSDVAHVGVPGRVGEHLQTVVLRLRRVLDHLEGPALGPALLPLPVERLRFVLAHVWVPRQESGFGSALNPGS